MPLPFYFLKPLQCSDVQNGTRKRECNIMPCKVVFWFGFFYFILLAVGPGGFPCAPHHHVSIEKLFSRGGGGREGLEWGISCPPAHQYSPRTGPSRQRLCGGEGPPGVTIPGGDSAGLELVVPGVYSK